MTIATTTMRLHAPSSTLHYKDAIIRISPMEFAILSVFKQFGDEPLKKKVLLDKINCDSIHSLSVRLAYLRRRILQPLNIHISKQVSTYSPGMWLYDGTDDKEYTKFLEINKLPWGRNRQQALYRHISNLETKLYKDKRKKQLDKAI